MKVFLKLNFLLLFLFFSCNNKESENQTKIVEIKNTDGVIVKKYYVDEFSRIQGAFNYYYQNGQDSVTYFYRDSILNGPFYYYDKLEKLKVKGNYKNGVLDGWVCFYNKFGELEEKQLYKKGDDFLTYKYVNKSLKELSSNNIHDKSIVSSIYFNQNLEVDETKSKYVKVKKINKNSILVEINGIKKNDNMIIEYFKSLTLH